MYLRFLLVHTRKSGELSMTMELLADPLPAAAFVILYVVDKLNMYSAFSSFDPWHQRKPMMPRSSFESFSEKSAPTDSSSSSESSSLKKSEENRISIRSHALSKVGRLQNSFLNYEIVMVSVQAE